MPSILLLPERRRFAGQAITSAIAARLGRADRSAAEPGERAQLERYFTLQPAGWPMAAIQRQFDADDAGDHLWLRADPAHVRADMTGARLMAWGNLAIDDATARHFLTALQPLFEEAGLEMSATAPDRWFLRVPKETSLPAFALPEQALGADLLEHLPQGEAGRQWRSLLSESQVILHNHPANAERAAHGKPPVNSLWFWGGGAHPDSGAAKVSAIDSGDAQLRALFAQSSTSPSGPVLEDFRRERDWQPVQARIAAARSLTLDFADGTRWDLWPEQRWRFWRRPVRRLEE